MKQIFTPSIVLCLLAGLIACGGSSVDQPSLSQLAQAAARGEDRVEVKQLAEWLIEERGDFVLVDLRTATDFEQGRIGSAQNLPLAQLFAEGGTDGLPRDRTVVTYSNDSETAAKAQVMLRLAGFDARLLAGGYNAWQQNILNPDIPAEELAGETLAVSEQRAFACYFVGNRSEGAAVRSTEPFVPPVFTEEEEQELKPLPPAKEESC
ncbi:MAG: rhodanese-like domain-containing protein [Xanthomonadales bacterium]|nr:rhodanese-like domain-containing protein [Xanthomonadales bacterium]